MSDYGQLPPGLTSAEAARLLAVHGPNEITAFAAGEVDIGRVGSVPTVSALARKVPIVGGMLISTCIVGCNYTNVNWIVVALLSLAFFGKGIGALGWAVVSDTAAKEIAGLSGGLFNTFGNTAGIVTPIVIAWILKETNSFNGALVFVGLNAVGAILSYLLIVPTIKRFELKVS